MAFPKLKSLPSPDNTLLRHLSSAFWRLTRRAKRPQPPHNVSNSHFPHFGVLSILRQRGVTLDHGDQETGTFLCIQVAANCSFGLSSSQERSYSILPGKENPLQALAELRHPWQETRDPEYTWVERSRPQLHWQPMRLAGNSDWRRCPHRGLT